MNSVFFPAHVVVVLRRIVNVISTISISNQYLLLKRAREEQSEQVPVGNEKLNLATGTQSPASWETLRRLREIEWPTWMNKGTEDRLHVTSSLGKQLAVNVNSSTTVKDATLICSGIESERNSPLNSQHSASHNYATEQQNLPNTPPQDRNDREPESMDIIHRLMQNPALYEPMRRPRYPIVLCHGLYGFDVRGPSTFPSLRMQYWSNVLNILRNKVGAEVIVTAVPGTGSITSRSENLDRILQDKARGRGINLMAHSMGGLDCRHLISHVKPTEYTPLSLTAISTPHRGSPFMDWCAENIGLGRLRRQELENSKLTQSEVNKLPTVNSTPATSPAEEAPKPDIPFSLSLSSLPSSFTTLLMSVLDSPAYSNLTSTYLNTVFNPSTPDDPRVKYFSVAGRLEGMSVWHPLWLPKMVLDGFEEKSREKLKKQWEERGRPVPDNAIWNQDNQWGNDGLVTVQSAQWGEFLGTLEGCDHWEMRGARGIELSVDLPLSSLGIGSLGSGGKTEKGGEWNLKDWGRFVGAWKKQEQQEKRGKELQEEVRTGVVASREPQSPEEHERERAHEEAVIKSSTDKLSAVFDWVVEQVPAPPKLTSKDKSIAQAEVKQEQKKKAAKSDLATKMDLERFYVALSKKLYDEGL